MQCDRIHLWAWIPHGDIGVLIRMDRVYIYIKEDRLWKTCEQGSESSLCLTLADSLIVDFTVSKLWETMCFLSCQYMGNSLEKSKINKNNILSTVCTNQDRICYSLTSILTHFCMCTCLYCVGVYVCDSMQGYTWGAEVNLKCCISGPVHFDFWCRISHWGLGLAE